MPTGFDINSFNDPEPLIDDVAWDVLSAYVDGETTPEEAHQVEERLKSDPHYLSAYNMLQATSASMQGVDEVEPPPALRAGILAATTQRRVSTLATLSRYALAIGSMAAAAAVIGIYFMPRTRGSVGFVSRPEVALNVPSPENVIPNRLPAAPRTDVKAPGRRTSSPPHASRNSEATVPERNIAPEEAVRVVPADFRVTSVPQPTRHINHSVGPSHAPRGMSGTTASDPGFSGVGGPQVTEVAYTPRPMMGGADFRPASTGIASDTHSEDQPLRTADEDISHPDAPVATTVQASEPQGPRVRFAKLLRSQLASDSPVMLTGADIKRIRDASMYGFDRASTESLPHRDSAALVVGRF